MENFGNSPDSIGGAVRTNSQWLLANSQWLTTTCSDLCEIVDASKLEQGGHAVRETADDEPVKGRCISHLDQNIVCHKILQEYSKILFAGIFQNIVRANIARILPICCKIIDVGTLGSSVRLCSEIVERVRTAVIPAEMVEKLTKSVKM